MSVKAAAEQTYALLTNALAQGTLPPNVADAAEKLCHRLREPVRVSVMGLPGAGKSSVVNLLLNKIVVPDGLHLPTTQFLHGSTAEALCTLEDGSITAVPADQTRDIASLNPIFVEFRMDLPALGRISVLEVVAPRDEMNQQRALSWAAKRTDIALWCTKHYGMIEQSLWAGLPEKVKDHALMLLTHADKLEETGELGEKLDELRFGSQHEFNKIMPLATLQALAARKPDGKTDKPLMQKSGGLTLISTILRQVDRGLQATVDQADLILHKFKDAPANPDYARSIGPEQTARVITKPVPETAQTPAHDKPVVEVTSSEPVAKGPETPVAVQEPPSNVTPMRVASQPHEVERPASQPFPTSRQILREAKPQAAAEPVTPARPVSKPRFGFMPKAKTSSQKPCAKPETCAAYTEALTHLRQQAKELSQRIASDDAMTSEDLMEASADNITWLSDYLEDIQVPDDPVLETTRSRALDATELVQLMQFEENDNAGLEALTLVIQLKRDLEAEVARSKAQAPVKAA